MLEHLGRNRDVDAADGDVHPSIVTRHHADLCRVLLGNADLTVTGAMMSNRAASLGIEDHAIMLMQGGGASCMVETGYLYPALNSVFDMHYSIRTEGHFAARDNSTLEIVTNVRQRTTRAMKPTSAFFYMEST